MSKRNRQKDSTTRRPSGKKNAHDKKHAALLKKAQKLTDAGDHQRACELLEDVIENEPRHPEAHALLGRAMHRLGKLESAYDHLQLAVDNDPNYAYAHNYLAYLYRYSDRKQLSLEHAKKACKSSDKNADYHVTLGNAYGALHYYKEAQSAYEKALSIDNKSFSAANNLANILKSSGDLEKSLKYYDLAQSIKPDAYFVFSNRITTLHYIPNYPYDAIANECKRWNTLFAPATTPERPKTDTSEPTRTLRIGLFSDGFRRHPVGYMSLNVMKHLSKSSFELIYYSSNNDEDGITKGFKSTATKWQPIQHLNDQDFYRQIVDDKIDILIDMTGHNAGNRMLTVSMEPAPVIVKWIGGLINTTGVRAIDYLISDAIETPEGVDQNYTENLIRLPDDYICYTPPQHAPDIGVLPATQSGVITFGCFNNPEKINEDLVREWAKLLHQIPNSRIYLKGMQFESPAKCQQIETAFSNNDIPVDRLTIEGPSGHRELLDCYNKVDIALDPWPYSGGLTTCEALYMGVPVITLPGPTFAGRHSATHLVNAGLPELVTNSWEEYRQRAEELSSDLDSLSTIRENLRDILRQSPVCDNPSFTRHFKTMLRAIWQRHCDEKPPAPLTFNKAGEAQFKDEKTPVRIQSADVSEAENDATFQWQFEGKLIAVDNGGQLLHNDVIRQLLQHNALELIAFDPSSIALESSLKQHNGVHYYPNTSLGNGQQGLLHACLDPKLSSTLPPLGNDDQQEATYKDSQVLTRLPLNTIAIDSIEGLPSIDWLVLDELNDAADILDNGTKALKNTLLLHVRVAFQPTHERQPNLGEVQHWASRHGFRFYRLHEPRHRSQIPSRKDLKERQATNLVSADALFIPSQNRLRDLTDSQRLKLAFLLHNAYGIKDLAYSLINQADQAASEKYLAAQDMISGAEFLSGNKQAVTSYDEDKRKVEAQLKNQSQPPQLTGDNKKESSRITKEVHRDPLGEPPQQPHYDWCIDKQIQVVDIGANPIDGTPPYTGLLEQGAVSLVGFEPQREALKKLEMRKGPHETYLPYVVGDGAEASLYLCKAPGMTSTLKPNKAVLDHFHGYPVWGTVEQIERVDTKRLDDLEEIGDVDWLKIDIQGGELTVFKNAKNKLSNTLVIQTEVNFIRLYENQPLFAEVDQWMREQGFMLHALLEQRKRLFAPLVINRQVHNGINQLTTADAVYIRDINQLESISDDEKKKMALILHAAYGSYDLAYRILQDCKNIDMESYVKNIKSDININIGKEKKIEKNVFVVGCGHTGTTLMASILGAHSAIHTVMRETNWFLSNGESFSSEYNNEALHAEAQGKTILCEKTPRHLYKIEEMRKKLPQSKFIIMVRDVKDVVFSLKNRSGDFSSSLRRWIDDNRKAMAHLNDEDTLLVYYEDIVASPQETLKKVCSFIGIPFETTMLDFSESNKTWFGVTPKETDGKGERNHLQRRAWQMTQPLQDRRGIWRGELSDEEVSIINHETDDIMRCLGYS